MQQISRRRQESALDDVLFDRAARADIKSLLFDPQKARAPEAIDIDRYFQSDLDSDKRDAVNAVLGTKDFLVINGPPGTGKTKLIAEMVLQYLEKNPGHRVLISSQTHNALDNALEKIRSVVGDDTKLNAVRIARNDEAKVSPAVKDLLLDNLVSVWLKTIKKKSTSYLEDWCISVGVDKRDVELGLAVGDLRGVLSEYDDARKKRGSVERALQEIEAAIQDSRKKLDTQENIELLEFNKERLAQKNRVAEEEIVRARRRYRERQYQFVEEFPADAEFFNSMDAPELAEWEESFLSGSDSLKKCKSIIELLQDWYERFGKSSDFYASFLTDSRIVAATCVGIGLKAYRDVDFDLCVVDEASKATPTESLLPISRSRKWVLVGDPAQLPPFIAQAAMDDSLLDKHGLSKDDLRTTLLDRLMDKLPEEAIKSLDTQYRMCPEIGNLISNCFYKGGLRTGRGAGFDFRKHLCIPKPVTWYCTSGCSNKFERKDGKSYQNRKEVYEISILLRRFNFAASVAGVRFSVALLSFYAAQVSALRREAATLSIECPNLSIVVDTVDAFQGRESDVCIVSVTRCNRSNEFGFINDANRVNVALSRGKEALVIVGDSRFCGDSGIDSPLSNVANYIVGNSNECALEYLE